MSTGTTAAHAPAGQNGIPQPGPNTAVVNNAEAAGVDWFTDKPYFRKLRKLQASFPALKSFVDNAMKESEEGRTRVREHFMEEYNKNHKLRSSPSRCICLLFHDDGEVTILDKCKSVGREDGFENVAALRSYLAEPRGEESRGAHRRLFILEDMEPEYIEVLGHHLGVDPLVFAEQMNAINFSDSYSIPIRSPPSMNNEEKSFTLRYHELRTLKDGKSIDTVTLQKTFAINSRRYERWRDIETPSAKVDRRHGFVRRAASFWTSQGAAPEGETLEQRAQREGLGWDAVILVDPAMRAARKTSPVEAAEAPFTTLILAHDKIYKTRAALFNAQGRKNKQPKLTLNAVDHISSPYHGGCSTLLSIPFNKLGSDADTAVDYLADSSRDLVSPLDVLSFYWTELAPPELVKACRAQSANASFYLLRHVMQYWISQLELINATISRAEWVADDYQASIDSQLSLQKWKQDLKTINDIAKDINNVRRNMNSFWRVMILNLERIGCGLGNENIRESASLALRGAQKDFLSIHGRMAPLRDRAEALNSVANDLANLRAAFRGVHDGEFSVRLSLFASIVFPLTLVAGIFSMSDEYLPGTRKHYLLWAIGLPLCLLISMGLVYGKRPWKILKDINEFKKILLERREKEKEEEKDKAKTEAAIAHISGNNHADNVRVRQRAQSDEEHAIAGAEDSSRSNQQLVSQTA